MLLRSENFTNDEGIEMIREYYGELNEDGSENITTVHECPVVEEVVVEEVAKESSVQEVLTSLANAASKEDVENILKEIKLDITNLENTINATLYCVGCVGTVFTAVHNDNVYEPLVTELTEDDYLSTNGDRYRIVAIPTGSYTVTVAFAGNSTDVVIDVTERGTRYFVPYELTIMNETSAGTTTLSLPNGATNVTITACGGGGGGAGGSTDYTGGGGGGGACIIDAVYNIPAGESTITVGTAGTAGKSGKTGGAGGSTVIGSVVTLGGGGGGGLPTAGTSGGTGGGKGGRGGYYSDSNDTSYGPSNAENGALGSAGTSPGTSSTYKQYGAAGGGSYGDGGDSGTNSKAGGDAAGHGGGGGGGGWSTSSASAGGAGYCGLVIIKKVVTSA